MLRSGKYSSFFAKLEIIVAVVLFFVMLVSCGLYINIKMNGKSANLPPLSDADKRMLLRSAGSESVVFDDDLIEPVFMGVRRQGESFAAFPNDKERRLFEESVYEAVNGLFAGQSSEMSFNSHEERLSFLDEIKNSEDYILVSFYSDLPAELFLPCMANNYNPVNNTLDFDVKNLFMLPDADGNTYGISVSTDCSVTVMVPYLKLSFNKISEEAYDVVKDSSLFEFNDSMPILPVLTSSFYAPKYSVFPSVYLYGKSIDSRFVQDLLAVFSINKNMVKSFSSGDNTETNYVEESRELVINDSGLVLFKSDDNGGIPIDEFLGYYSGNGGNYSFADKIFALKSLVNKLNVNADFSFSVSGLNYNIRKSSLRVYFKYSIDGCLMTDNAYDAVFEISGNLLTYAEFFMYECGKSEEMNIVYPQNYAAAVLDDGSDEDYVICPVLSGKSLNNVKSPVWTKISFSEKDGE